MTKAKRTAKKLHHIDRAMSETAAAERQSGPMRVLAAVNELSDQPPLIALSAATLAAGLVLRRPALTRGGARMLASHLLATAIKTAVKRSVDRTRPHSVDDGYDYRLEKGGSRSHHYSSFPSGHTAGAVAVARAAARTWPAHAPAAAVSATAVGAMQLPIGKHYAGDVIAGALIGYAAEAAVGAIEAAVLPAMTRRSAS
ncbi:PAP2 superfamily protein [Sphingomonas guangdongensis]|uniref:PAP2 superfamily protein n=1 Tax=Sphingomonas guangdongensis TaxID=1141890 RepID=A0A285QDP9_9SPHN|nr:phosphatase PAP2 family protein [Sphingomonas guangdongensis]SOB80060.1 PAP2 superfamily protein [Sphingomonas guangdongensis]